MIQLEHVVHLYWTIFCRIVLPCNLIIFDDPARACIPSILNYSLHNSLPCNSMIFDDPARACSPSIFWVMTTKRLPCLCSLPSHSAMAICACNIIYTKHSLDHYIHIISWYFILHKTCLKININRRLNDSILHEISTVTTLSHSSILHKISRVTTFSHSSLIEKYWT